MIDIQRIIAHLRERGIGVLITDHNVRETLKITDRAYILRDGNVFRSGTPYELASDPEVRRVYLGEAFRLDDETARPERPPHGAELWRCNRSWASHTRLSQRLILTPSLQQAIKLLPLTTLELAEVLEQEVMENPLLEEVPGRGDPDGEEVADAGGRRQRPSATTR